MAYLKKSYIKHLFLRIKKHRVVRTLLKKDTNSAESRDESVSVCRFRKS